MAIGIIGNDKHNKLLNSDEKNKYNDKTYIPKLDNDNDSHSYICREIKQNSTILDIGCAHGFIGKILKNELNCTVYGIEVDDIAIKLSEKTGCYEKLYLMDINDTKSKEYEKFMNEKIEFDYIIFSDVLEHLINPASVLFRFAEKLKNNGNVLVSLPNIAHYDIVNGLLNENFNYSDMGLLDNTHLRFFTKYSFAEYIKFANDINTFKFDCKLINKTIAEPYFIGEYPNIDKIIEKNNNSLFVLQNIFKLTKIDKKQSTKELDEILKENKINMMQKIEEKIKYLNDENIKLANELNVSKLKNEELNDINIKKTDNLDYLYNEYNNIINSKSWKITKPLRSIEKIRKNILRKLKSKKDYKQSILILVHSWINIYDKNITNVGGTTNHVLDIINSMKENKNFYVLTVINNKYMLVTFKNGKQNIYDLNLSVKIKNYDGYDFEFYKLINRLIDELNIDLIHIHHVINFPCDIEYINPKIKKIMTIHDYTPICARYFLIDYKHNCCLNVSLNKCLKCINNKYNISVRNTAFQNLFKTIDHFIIPDDSVGYELNKHLKFENYDVIPHGIDINCFTQYQENNKNSKKIKNIAFVGFIDNHKGFKYMKDLIEKNTNSNIVYHLFGHIPEIKINGKFINHGKYNKNILPKLLNDNEIDLVLLLSTCAETFSYTLSEVVFAKIPCLVFDLGALGSRVKKDGIGWVIDRKSSYKDIINFYDKIFEQKEYNKKIENINNYYNVSIEDMIRSIEKKYNQLYNKNKKNYLEIENNLDKYYLKYKL